MIDTRARSYFDYVFNKSARQLLKVGLNPNQITAAAFVTGIGAGLALFIGHPWLATALLWFSGYLDAVDGAMARQSGRSNSFGAMLDIISDRIVELAIFWALVLNHPEAQLAMLGLVSAVLLSMTVFLTTGMMVKNTGKKSFYYQAGLMERTEGFIASTAMILVPSWLVFLTWLYAGLIGVTIVQRLMQARRLMNRSEL